MAAEVLALAGVSVDVYDAMPSAGRKFLLAGKGGLNLTHSEGALDFASRFGARRAVVETWLAQFGAEAVRAWAQGLGVETFVGSSGRVFPKDMKAAPLLRAWLHRLRARGVRFHMRHRWQGWESDGDLLFESPEGAVQVRAHAGDTATVLALGGASWPRLGSDGAWVAPLLAKGVDVAPLLPANCGFDVAFHAEIHVASSERPGWSPFFAAKFAGQPFKSVAIRVVDPAQDQGADRDMQGDAVFQRKGEFVATATGVEGSLIYAASSMLRDTIVTHGEATFHVDLLPDLPAAKVAAEVHHPRGARSLASHLKSRLHLDGIKMAMLVEVLGKDGVNDAARLAAAIKHLPITVIRARPVAEAISSAGGVRFDALDDKLMMKDLPGVFCAGEMLDWEAPTGGYLLTACLASGRVAGQGALKLLSL
jgi:uncharacterized flavoprotein (TIGR03862 family)